YNFFFFKQKTAYDIETVLEFRRVLFRSPDVEFLALVRIGDDGGLLQHSIQLRVRHLGVVGEVAAGGGLGARGVVQQPQHIGPDLGVGGADGVVAELLAVFRGGQSLVPGAEVGRVELHLEAD